MLVASFLEAAMEGKLTLGFMVLISVLVPLTVFSQETRSVAVLPVADGSGTFTSEALATVTQALREELGVSGIFVVAEGPEKPSVSDIFAPEVLVVEGVCSFRVGRYVLRQGEKQFLGGSNQELFDCTESGLQIVARDFARGAQNLPPLADAKQPWAIGSIGEHQFDCERRLPGACFLFGLAVRAGLVTGESPETASKYFAIACEENGHFACWFRLLSGDPKKSSTLAGSLSESIVEAAGLGDPVGLLLTSFYPSAIGVKAEEKYDWTICAMLAHVCDKAAVAEACAFSGLTSFLGACGGRDLAGADRRLGLACKTGKGYACFVHGLMFEKGEGVDIHPKRARELYEKSCELGFQRGCYALASCLESGKCGPADKDRALLLFEAACEKEDGFGCYGLATHLMFQGDKGKCNDRVAGLLSKSCSRNCSEACTALGLITLAGKCVKEDALAASEHLTKACEMGSAFGCEVLGRLMVGAEAPDQARKPWEKACRYGQKDACKNLKSLGPARE